MRNIGIFLLLALMVAGAWFYSIATDTREQVSTAGLKIILSDGDSFAIGPQRLRLKGIDAPELHQDCLDAAGKSWACGKAARGALEQLLASPGLSCVADAADKFQRRLARCSATGIPDIAAVQVRNGMAITQEFNGMRDYGEEEDAARAARSGIWRGTFTNPRAWRDAHPR